MDSMPLRGRDLVVDRLFQYALLMRFDRPIGIMLLLWPTLWALWFASQGVPTTRLLVIFTLGVILMRSAGCVINDYADRNIDPHVARTRNRPIAAGRVGSGEALKVFAVLLMCAAALVALTNTITFALSLGAALLAILYPFMKRYTYMPQVFLGAAFGWSVPMVFTAQIGIFPPYSAWLLFIAAVVWTVAYDTIYAMVDRDDDVKIGVKSTAILFGELDRVMIALLHALVIAILVLVAQREELGNIYFAGLGGAAISALYQQYLIRNRDPKDCLKAFAHNNWFGMSIFLGIAGEFALNVGGVNG